jgi:hypothetical protein
MSVAKAVAMEKKTICLQCCPDNRRQLLYGCGTLIHINSLTTLVRNGVIEIKKLKYYSNISPNVTHFAYGEYF